MWLFAAITWVENFKIHADIKRISDIWQVNVFHVFVIIYELKCQCFISRLNYSICNILIKRRLVPSTRQQKTPRAAACESISCSESAAITLHSWTGARGGHARRLTANSSTCCHFFTFIQSGKRARRWPLLSKTRWGPLRSIQVGVRKIDGFLWDLEFMSLEGFFVNKGEKWKCVKMKTEWEETGIMCGLRARTQEVTLNRATPYCYYTQCGTNVKAQSELLIIVISNFIFYFKKEQISVFTINYL